MPLRPPYPVVVLGHVGSGYAGVRNGRALSAAKQYTLAVLVAAGHDGIDASGFRTDGADGPVTVEALRMSITRLREHLPEGAVPGAAGGRYRLDLAADEVDAWHLHRLLAEGLPAALDLDRLRHLLRPVEPFAPHESEPTLAAAAERVRQQQRRLLERVAAERPELVGGELVEHLSAHLADDPYNERLLLLCGRALARSGHRRDALNLLARARREFAELGLEVVGQLGALERDLLDGRVTVTVTERADPEAPELPRSLAEHLGTAFVGADDHVVTLRRAFDGATAGGATFVTIDGRSGVGKSRACAELARHARSRRARVLYAAATSDEGAALGPLLALLPGLRQAVRDALDRHADLESRKAAMWSHALRALDDVVGTGQALLLIDDGQWLDPYTAEFLTHLVDRSGEGRLVVAVAGRADDAGGAWLRLVEALHRRNAAAVSVAPLDRAGLAQLVQARRPGLPASQVDAIAGELEPLSGGLPGIAGPLVDGMDAVTLALPTADAVRPDRALEAAVRRLAADSRTVGAVGSVVGPAFDLATAAEVSGLGPARTLDALDDLVRRGLVLERGVTDFAVSHLLVQSAFLAAESRSRIASWHQAAAERWRDDPHRVARHAAAAVPLVPAGEAAALLRRSAERYLDDGLPRSAVAAYRRALELAGELPPADGGRYARALDLSAASDGARRVRHDAFERAMAAGRAVDALHIAVSGLPEAEPIDGDPTVIAHLRRLDPGALAGPPDGPDGASPAWTRASVLVRQLAIHGRLDDAAVEARALPALAAEPAQRVDAAVLARLVVSATSPPDVRLERLAAAAADVARVDPVRASGFHMVRAIDLYEAGRVPEALAAWADLERWRDDLGVWRRWHTMLVAAMVAADAGLMTEARTRRRDAFDFATRSGVAEALNALLVAEFVDVWLRDGLSALRPALDAGAIDPGRSVLMRAGAAAILAGTGDLEAGAGHAVRVVDAVARSPLSQGVAALALVADVLARSDRHEAADTARTLLASRGDSMVVVGAGAACLGPVERCLAHLAHDAAERRERLRRAVALADRADVLLWRVVCRRDLADASREPGRADRGATAAALAAGTEIEDLAHRVTAG